MSRINSAKTFNYALNREWLTVIKAMGLLWAALAICFSSQLFFHDLNHIDLQKQTLVISALTALWSMKWAKAFYQVAQRKQYKHRFTSNYSKATPELARKRFYKILSGRIQHRIQQGKTALTLTSISRDIKNLSNQTLIQLLLPSALTQAQIQYLSQCIYADITQR